MKTPNLLHRAVLATLLLTAASFGTLRALDVPASNGQIVPVTQIRKATPEGLEIQLKQGEDFRTIPWGKLDVAAIQQRNPDVYDAYLKTLNGKTIELNLTSNGDSPKPATPPSDGEKSMPAAGGGRKAGYFELEGGSGNNYQNAFFALNIAAGVSKIQAVAVFLRGDECGASPYGRPRMPIMSEFFESNTQVARLGVDMSNRGEDESTFYQADKGSGDAILKALDQFAGRTGFSELKSVPILFAASELDSAGFAFSFTQWKPERVLGAALARGSHYMAEPTPEGMKVPTLFMVGDFDFRAEQFTPEHTGRLVYNRYRDKNPLWTLAVLPEGRPSIGEPEWTLTSAFFEAMLKHRLGEDGSIGEFDASTQRMGNLEIHEVEPVSDVKLSDPEFTWLPTADFADVWQKYVRGELGVN